MDIIEWLLVVVIAFLSGMGNRIAGEVIDYVKKKRKNLQDRILNGYKINNKAHEDHGDVRIRVLHPK